MYVLIVFMSVQQALGQTETLHSPTAILADTEFTRGFVLTAASHPGPKIEIGILQTGPAPAGEAPRWRLAQWGTNHLLEPGACIPSGDGLWGAENPAKRVTLKRAENESTTLRLEVLGGAEYAGRLRAAGEAWPHLLIEQRFLEPVRLGALQRLLFKLGMRVDYCRAVPGKADQLDPNLHTAQVSAFWTVHNLSPENPDYKDMIWFGIPLFDARHDVPPPHYAMDAGKDDATGKFICMLDGKRFWSGRTGDGQWRTLETDLLPLLREALTISQEHGHLKHSGLEDLGLTTFNLGWEIPGPYDAAIELRGLALLGW